MKCSIIRTAEKRIASAKFALANLLPGEDKKRDRLERIIYHYSRLTQSLES